MLDHPFRAIGTALGLLFAGGLAWALTLGGFSLDDPELEDAMEWARSYKAEYPEEARAVGLECKKELTRSPWTRDGALDLFNCIRAKAEARGA